MYKQAKQQHISYIIGVVWGSLCRYEIQWTPFYHWGQNHIHSVTAPDTFKQKLFFFKIAKLNFLKYCPSTQVVEFNRAPFLPPLPALNSAASLQVDLSRCPDMLRNERNLKFSPVCKLWKSFFFFFKNICFKIQLVMRLGVHCTQSVCTFGRFYSYKAAKSDETFSTYLASMSVLFFWRFFFIVHNSTTPGQSISRSHLLLPDATSRVKL